jgi:ketosteroid isomerase-like protein
VAAENVDAVRRFIEAFNRRDVDALVVAADPAVELDEWREAPGAQTYHGPDGVRAAIESWFETWEWMEVEIAEIVDAGVHVFVILDQRAKGSGSGAEVEIRSHNVYTFRDGKVVRIQLFIEPGPALEAAGLAPDYQKEKR